ncbi:MAG: hypothetical protein Q8R37_00370 [Nanoarchaeota archaeon]|nr:hypothetical protein [Nanoarchaeota archaeon]
MEHKPKLWKVEYTFNQTMWSECFSGRYVYFVAAGDDTEAIAKGDNFFSSVSTQYQMLLNSGESINGDYGILSDLKKSAQEYTVQEIFCPVLDGLDKKKFDLEAILIDGGKAVRYVVKLK